MAVLNELDVKILKLLIENGRASFREIAKQVGVTTPTINSRIKRLKDIGVVKRFTLELDLKQLNFVKAQLLLSVDLGNVKSVVKELRSVPLVGDIYTTSDSEFGVIAMIEGNVEAIFKFISEFKLENIKAWKVLFLKQVAAGSQALDLEIASIECAYCGGIIAGEGVKRKIENKFYHFCCDICRREFENKYQQIKRGI
ncbi:MAG: winged helix-turn-helix transcriptional regulator [Methanocellales archaeon]